MISEWAIEGATRNRGLNMSNRTGVYFIRNVQNEKFYVGSAGRNFMSRWSEHKVRLENGRHGNPHLQAAWDKYGPECFEYGVIEDCALEQCLVREQFWMDFLKPEYNCLKTAGSPFGRRATEETKRKMRLAKLGRKHSKEAIERMRIAQSNKSAMSAETRLKISRIGKNRVVSPETRAKISAFRKAHPEKFESRLGTKHSEETKRKIAAGNRGKKMTPEAIAKSVVGRVGFKHSEASLEKMRQLHTGFRHTEEAKRKIGIGSLGRTWSDERKAETRANWKKWRAAE